MKNHFITPETISAVLLFMTDYVRPTTQNLYRLNGLKKTTMALVLIRHREWVRDTLRQIRDIALLLSKRLDWHAELRPKSPSLLRTLDDEPQIDFELKSRPIFDEALRSELVPQAKDRSSTYFIETLLQEVLERASNELNAVNGGYHWQREIRVVCLLGPGGSKEVRSQLVMAFAHICMYHWFQTDKYSAQTIIRD